MFAKAPLSGRACRSNFCLSLNSFIFLPFTKKTHLERDPYNVEDTKSKINSTTYQNNKAQKWAILLLPTPISNTWGYPFYSIFPGILLFIIITISMWPWPWFNSEKCLLPVHFPSVWLCNRLPNFTAAYREEAARRRRSPGEVEYSEEVWCNGCTLSTAIMGHIGSDWTTLINAVGAFGEADFKMLNNLKEHKP